MIQLLKEPLFHFLFFGAGLFLLNGLFWNDSGVESSGNEPVRKAIPSKEIVVSQGRIIGLLEKFEKVWQRPPTVQELKGLINEHVREEVMYREALALGLDENDGIIRRRLRQKLEFITEDIVALAEPSDKDLTDYLESHPDAFRLDSQFTFRQVFLNVKKRADSIDADTKALLKILRAAGESAEIRGAGDALMLEQVIEKTGQRDVARIFGQEFGEGLLKVPTGSWQGPVSSGFGVHLVYISERIDGRLPALDEVRDAVVLDWSTVKRKESNEALYKKWRDKYTVTVAEIPTGSEKPSE